MKNNPVVHFEMPARDKKRTAKFYKEVFGWKMTQMGEEMGGYLLAGTTPTDEKQMVTTPGQINGGFFDYKDEEGFNAPHLVISVDNLEKSMEDVKKAGGKIISIIMEIPGVGRYTSLKDTEGNVVGILQPAM